METPESLVGARLAIGFSGCEASDQIIAHLREIHAQSLVVFAHNFISSEQFTNLIRRLEDALGRRLLIMVDHEGGRIVRFCDGVTLFPDALAAGRVGNADKIEDQGATEAQELKQLSVSLSLVPCIDVYVEGSNPVIGDRSYGSDPEHVSRMGCARIRGLQSHGVAACAKHFPGLGAVPHDPHAVLPTINLDWTLMEEVHLPPFQAAVTSGVATVMSSHVCYPGLGDPQGLPATFSASLIRGFLRERLHFEGPILTDDLKMGAMQLPGGIKDAVVMAAEAGHDLLLICSDIAAQKEAFSSLCQAYQSGRFDTKELEASSQRLNRLRQKFLSRSCR